MRPGGIPSGHLPIVSVEGRAELTSSGVFVTQFITYCNSKAKDKPWVLCIIAGVTFMACFLTGTWRAIVHTSLTEGYIWWFASHTFVYHFGVHQVFFETVPL